MEFIRFIKRKKKKVAAMRNLLKRCRIAHEPNKNQWYNKRRRTRADNFFRSTVKAHY